MDLCSFSDVSGRVHDELGACMSKTESKPRQKKRSRVVTGFHRLGLVLAVPLFLSALGVGLRVVCE
jgi:hypothetical protein